MAHRPSKIDRLPDEIKELIGQLRRGGRTIDEILAKLRELNVDVSRSGLGKHIQGLDKIAEVLSRQHDISEALVERFGDAPESRTARMNIQLMHAQLTRLVVPDDDGTVTLDPQGAYFLSTALQRLAQASKADTEREIKIEERARKKALAEAATALDGALKAAEASGEKGLSAERVAQLRRDFLGVKPPAIEGEAKVVG